MSPFEQAREVFTTTGSPFVEDVVYHASPAAAGVTYRGLFDPVVPQDVRDDATGRAAPSRAVLCLETTVTLSQDGRDWFEIRGQQWSVEGSRRGRHWLVVELKLHADQTIRRIQPSTRN